MSTLTTRQTFALVVLFVVVCVAFIQLDNRNALDPVKDGLREVLSPMASVLNRVTDGTNRQSAQERQIAQLKAQVASLQAQNAQLQGQANENKQLREVLGLKQQHPGWKTLQASVVNPDPTNLQKFITIDKGAKDGIKKGMAVVDPYFYVGQVTDVQDHSARVMLIIDQSQQVGAQLQGSGTDGIIYGMWQRGGRLELRHLDRDVVPKVGDVVITSDKSDSSTAQVPGDIIIGKVDGQPVTDAQNDTLTVSVLPVARFDTLKVVSVILGDGS